MDWDQLYIDEHTPWDKGAPAPPLLEWLKANPGKVQGNVLVPGSGIGHDAAAIVDMANTADVIAIDISTTATNAASERHQAEGLQFLLEDLFHLPETYLDRFDWIWEHTCFCAIDPSLRDEYVNSVHSTLKKGGQLLAVFFLDPYDEEHRPGEGPPHGTSLEEISQRFVSSGKFSLLESYVPSQSYQGREGLEQVMRFRAN